MSDTARTPEEIRADIEHTREELAETAAALAEKADVKARAHEKVEETKAQVHAKVDETRAKVIGTAGAVKQRASDVTPESVTAGAQNAAGAATTKAKKSPIQTSLLAGFATGVVVGWIIWSRR